MTLPSQDNARASSWFEAVIADQAPMEGVHYPDSSSEKLAAFLKQTGLHKKTFAALIGVTLSYVYNLLDVNEPFSTRPCTLERIATVMGIPAFTLAEYPAVSLMQQPPNEGLLFLKAQQAALGLKNLDFLLAFQPNERFAVLEFWRGAQPFPLDWAFLVRIAQVLGLPAVELFPYWQERLAQSLSEQGLSLPANQALLQAMQNSAKVWVSSAFTTPLSSPALSKP